jgi:hypothetical protein
MTYDILAYVQRIVLPALATFIATLGQIWNWTWPVEQVVLTITAIDTFMGIVLRISSNQYFDHLEQMASLDVPDQEEEEGKEGIG